MIIKTLLALPPVAGTLTRGLTHFVRILAHVLAPQSLALGARVKMEKQFFFGDLKTVIRAQPDDKDWGKGLEVTFECSGKVCKVGFACHPEFANFEDLNSLSHEMLFEKALRILESGKLNENIKSASNSGIKLLVNLNDNVT